MDNCNNCGYPFSGNYCPECGQKANDGQLVLKQIIRDFADRHWDLNGPFIKTVRGLFTHPAELSREYIAGKRRRYTNPVSYFVTILALFLIIKNLIDYDILELYFEFNGRSPRDINMPDSALQDYQLYFEKPIYLFADKLNLFMLVFVFVYAGISKTFFPKSGRNYAEYITLSLYVLAQYVLFSTAVMFLTKLYFPSILLNYVFLILYSMWVLIRFHEGGRIYRFMMAFYSIFISWFAYLFVGFFISQLVVRYFGI